MPPLSAKPSVSPTVRTGSPLNVARAAGICDFSASEMKTRAQPFRSSGTTARTSLIARLPTDFPARVLWSGSRDDSGPSTPIRNSSGFPAKVLSGHSVKRLKFRRKKALISISGAESCRTVAAWTNGDSARSAPERSATRSAARTPSRPVTECAVSLELPRQRSIHAAWHLGRVVRERTVARFKVRPLKQVLPDQGGLQRRKDLPADPGVHLCVPGDAPSLEPAHVPADGVELDVLDDVEDPPEEGLVAGVVLLRRGRSQIGAAGVEREVHAEEG